MGRFFEMLPVLIPTSFDQQAFTYFQVDSRSNKTIEQMVDEENTDIHIAATLNHADATHRILSNHVQWVEERDENGDQPAHIAARLGNIQTLRVLIEFDAPMETRNYNLLTPIGEARINQQFEAIHLLRENYIFRSFDGIERYVYRRIHPSAIPSQTVARATTRRLRCMKEKRDDENVKRVEAQLHHMIPYYNACSVQKWWRRMRNYITMKISTQTIAATKVQAIIRMYAERSFYLNFYRDLFCRKCLVLATACQRLWRGYLARASTRALIERRNLPDPKDPKNHDHWMMIQEESHPPIRQFGILAEYILSGAPKTWEDRRIKRQGKYFRDVKFFVHCITRKSYWYNPSSCSEDHVQNRDHYQATVFKIQHWWRVRMLHKGLSLVAKAGRIMSSAEKSYASNAKDETVLYNYTLYVHVILKEYDRAKTLYSTCMSHMADKGIDNAFILYSFAIFLASHNREDDIDLVDELIYRGRLAEDRWKQYHSRTTGAATLSIYDIANCVYYFKAVTNPSSEDWYQFGLCRMLVYNDLKGARKAFNQALHINSKDLRVKAALTKLFQKENVTIRFL